ncbi:MAG: glucose-6-phosphate isomerase [Pseudomonadota bacterium]|nr:glucose-6-phosphate isomerase [Pseudomonadota bacterium]
MNNLTQLPEWEQLASHQKTACNTTLSSMFDNDPDRAKSFSLEAGNIFLDYSKNHVNKDIMANLFRLARACHVPEHIFAMFSGEKINFTENRPALHVALRAPLHDSLRLGKHNIIQDVHHILNKIEKFVDLIEKGQWKGFQGDKITDIVNIGIGGSDLGPVMVVEALKAYHSTGIRPHFVSNVDACQLLDTLNTLNPGTTLFIISSKTFTTQETLTNAHSARDWFLQSANKEDIRKHFVAVSTNADAVSAFGIDTDNMFEFWDWVGGRYSLWSAIGLSIALTIGMSNFRSLLKGAHVMDEHFRTAPLESNLPATLALIGIWNTNFVGAQNHAILPYSQHLSRLPAYLQQLEMESNGKRTNQSGHYVNYSTCPIIWGEVGTNGQHAFYQLIHQGTPFISADFILIAQSPYSIKMHQDMLIANGIAQTEALMRGRSVQEAEALMLKEGVDLQEAKRLAPHRSFPGNRPTSTLFLPELSPETLGELIALYEHKVFVQGTIWNINSFDQWGVELGKKLAGQILSDLRDKNIRNHDSSTNHLMERYLKFRKN